MGIAPVVVLVLLAAAPAPAAPAELLPDGGFEKGLGGWEARNASGALKVDVDAKVRKSGKASAHLVKSGGPSAFRADGLACALPEVPAGAKVKVSAEVRGKDLRNAWLKFEVRDESGTGLLDRVAVHEEILQGTFDWRRVEAEFEVPAEAATAEVVLYLYLDGEAWLDEVSVTTLGKPRPGERAPPRPLPPETVKWLDAHAVKVKHLRVRGGLEDLAPLKEILGDARIVQLGENTHRDGACFEAKARLVRFLHEEMGFEVLAFESGLYECDRANALLAGGSDPRAAMAASVFGIWRVPPVERLFEYLGSRAREAKPLLLAGFDCRASGAGASRLFDELGAFLAPVGGIAPADRAAVARLESLMDAGGDAYRPPKKDLDAGLAAWERIRKSLDGGREALVSRHGAAETEFLSRALDNWRRREEFERSKSDGSMGTYGSGNLRDAAMADNLRWLAETRHPGKRIVTWGATFHLARGLAGVEMDGNARHYEGCRNMGQAVHEAFGAKAYTVGFAAWGGKGGSMGQEFPLAKPRNDSVEDVLHRYGAPYLFVDLRAPGGPFRGRLRMAPLSYSRNIVADWTGVLDGVFFIDEMTPAR